MYAYNFVEFCKDKSPDDIIALAAKLREIQATHGSRAADDFFIQTVGIHPMFAYNESYYHDVVNFDAAHLLAIGGQAEEASRLMSNTPIMANAGGFHIFPEHVRQSLEIYEKHLKATERGIPPLLITSIPKSGSASLTQTLSDLTDSPIVRLSLGVGLGYAIVESWLKRFISGGMITHEHFGASEHNLRLLKMFGVSRIVVQLRDPRACMWSRLQANIKQKRQDDDAVFERVIQQSFKLYIEWITGWLNAERATPWLSIRWVYFNDYRQNSWQVVADILSDTADNPAIQPLLEQARQKAAQKAPVSAANFNQGDDMAWREHTSEALRQEMWDMLPISVITKLRLER